MFVLDILVVSIC